MEISKIMFKFVFIKWLTSNMKTLFTLSSKELSKKIRYIQVKLWRPLVYRK